jgi:glycosyltransferase involved in cell wall biosynthesis
MRILIFHGYLLEGTGSNVYNARLAAALAELGHEVHLLCQDRHPERYAFLDAAGSWEQGELDVRALPGRRLAGARATLYRPDIGPLLPVYVADRYEGVEARTFAQCSDAEVAAYVDANAAAVRDVVARVRPQLALANHLVMAPAILARALDDLPYAVKVHGSALEYTVKPAPERFLGYAREGLEGARAVLVGSHHTAASLWETIGDPWLPLRTRLGPPGVDVERFVPRDRARAGAGLRALAQRLEDRAHDREPEGSVNDSEPDAGDDAFAREDAPAAAALRRIDPARDRLVAFVGKLIVSKGIDLLVAAWPLVLREVPGARLVVVGFGAYRDGLEDLVRSLNAGDLAGARQIACAGRSREALATAEATHPAREPLRHLLAFFDGLAGAERVRYLMDARSLSERVLLTGRLDHDQLSEVLPACEAVIVPSTFPEAFGMVAVEAAACGALPVSAAHSGLAEVADTLAAAVPPAIAPLLTFPVDDCAVRALAERVVAWLRAEPAVRAQARAALVSTVRERWSWAGVARGVIAAASGELGALAEP